jgi:DNA-directed RNA polymerase subunit RPC12/RpoP
MDDPDRKISIQCKECSQTPFFFFINCTYCEIKAIEKEREINKFLAKKGLLELSPFFGKKKKTVHWGENVFLE